MLLLSFSALTALPALLLAGACLLLLWLARPRVAGTTLTAPWAWAVAAIVLVAGVEGLVAAAGGETGTPPAWAEAARWAAAMLGFCPIVGVLGAKRPQHRGWFWVVLCLWITLALPSGQWLLVSNGAHFGLFPAWKLFVAGLLALTLLNYLPTRHWLSAVAVVAGQWVLVSGQLPMPGVEFGPWRSTIALSLLAAAILWAMRGGARPSSVASGATIAELDAAWLGFRNAYGAFWGLRILQRVNQTADICHWPVHLAWQGFVPSDDSGASAAAESPTKQSTSSVDEAAISPQQAEEIAQTLRTLLRRFV